LENKPIHPKLERILYLIWTTSLYINTHRDTHVAYWRHIKRLEVGTLTCHSGNLITHLCIFRNVVSVRIKVLVRLAAVDAFTVKIYKYEAVRFSTSAFCLPVCNNLETMNIVLLMLVWGCREICTYIKILA